MSEINYINFFKRHLNISWLRPENVLCDTITSVLINRFKIAEPSLDLGCGNGIFSFITAGGDFSIDYDNYINIDSTKNFWKNEDIYDACKIKNVSRFIIKKPSYFFTVGLDNKVNLLNQAKSLNFYQKIFKHDANSALPFEDGQFKTVFSNIIYWLRDLKKSLRYLYNILDNEGNAILCLPNTKFLTYCTSYNWRKEKSELLHLLNRGRSDCMQWVISYKDFSSIAKKIGFDIIYHSYYLSPLTLKIWDVGLRPLSPVLIKMANKLNQENRRNIKLEWIDIVLKFLMPLYEIEKNSKKQGGFHFFVLKKAY